MAFTPKLLQQGAGGAGAAEKYIENLFSTYLYTGTGTGYAGSEQNIINGIDVSGKGALIWIKARESTAGYNSYWNRHQLYDTNRGITYALSSNTTDAHGDTTDSMSTRADGFRLASGGSYYQQNFSGVKYVSWTFRKQPKFFDVVTWVGTGGVRALTHSLGSVPGSIFVKKIVGAPQSWAVYHRSLGATKGLALDLTNAEDTWSGYWNNTEPTSTQFTVGAGFNAVDIDYPGTAYVAYLFAHDAGGFGLTGTDNVISCGTFTTNGSGVYSVNLGYEPQWVMIKRSSTGATGSWYIYDNMRGMLASGAGAQLVPNSSNAEFTGYDRVNINATGFFSNNVDGQIDGSATYIYIAIRRGPMKVPTVGTSVFSPEVQTPAGGFSIAAANSGFPIDWLPTRQKGVVTNWFQTSRLTNNYMSPSTTEAEAAYTYGFDLMQGVRAEWSTNTTVSYAFRRAPGFFDAVCYTGTGSATTFTHNLGVAPELMIIKSRSAVVDWKVYQKDLGTLYGGGGPAWQYNLTLNSTASTDFSTSRWSQDPTSTVFGVATNADTNGSGSTYVAYLFATCAGVSKVGSYTGTGATLQIDCGFTSGVRFVLIKRTNSNGGWFVWDSARGIVSGNDPYLRLESTSAEVTNTDYIDSYSAGFELNASATDVNNSGDKFIFLAIA